MSLDTIRKTFRFFFPTCLDKIKTDGKKWKQKHTHTKTNQKKMTISLKWFFFSAYLCNHHRKIFVVAFNQVTKKKCKHFTEILPPKWWKHKENGAKFLGDKTHAHKRKKEKKPETSDLRPPLKNNNNTKKKYTSLFFFFGKRGNEDQQTTIPLFLATLPPKKNLYSDLCFVRLCFFGPFSSFFFFFLISFSFIFLSFFPLSRSMIVFGIEPLASNFRTRSRSSVSSSLLFSLSLASFFLRRRFVWVCVCVFFFVHPSCCSSQSTCTFFLYNNNYMLYVSVWMSVYRANKMSNTPIPPIPPPPPFFFKTKIKSDIFLKKFSCRI